MDAFGALRGQIHYVEDYDRADTEIGEAFDQASR